MRERYYYSQDLFSTRERNQLPDLTRFYMHTHSLAEIFCFLEGGATFHVEGTEYPLEPGDILLIRPMEAHYIEVDPILPYERLVINLDLKLFDSLEKDTPLLAPFFDREVGKRNLYRASDLGTEVHQNLLDSLKRHQQNRLGTMADIILLLDRVKAVFDAKPPSHTQPNSLESQILRYINANLSVPLSLDTLCDRYYISRAQLCRRFKKATGTSVGKYISAKRLILSQQMIRQGQKPTEIFAQCGFQDYSTFYRAYTKYFGYSPKAEYELSPLPESPEENVHIIA